MYRDEYRQPQESRTSVINSQGVVVLDDSEVGGSVIVNTRAEDGIEELRDQVERLMSLLPSDKRREVESDFEQFKQQVRAPKPDHRYLSVSAKGLVEAAKAVGQAAPPILATVQGILKVIGMASIVL